MNRRTHRTSAALALALLLGLLPAAATAHAAADTTPPVVLDLTVTPSTTTINGTAATKIVVSVHLQDDSGICTSCFVDADSMASYAGVPLPYVQLDPLTPTVGLHTLTAFTSMKLTSGTAQDGWWSMTRIATGLWKGTHDVTRVAAADTAGNVTDVDPRRTPLARSLTVNATDVPHISLGVVPSILPYGANTFTVKGRAYLEPSGTALGNRVLLLCQDTGCGIEGSYSGIPVRTNAAGYYSVTTQRQALGLMLFKALGGNGSSAYPTTFYSNPLYTARSVPNPRSAHYLTLQQPKATSVPAGSPVTLKGATDMHYDTSAPEHWRSISVQRLVAGTWSTESTALIEKTTVQQGIHTYTLVAHPPKGTWSYRVYRTSTPGFAPTARYLSLTGR